ncbi:hypothetical protein [Corynebacterium riegelii]|uniref:hypothetical protein n=1 Tax=Corynebacterium riegelii TaxID=156976 RepID=UPI00191F5302|nr:hypothetical protein [Corynebacterium riegelii]QQU84737.1 hypothetical protein I6I71_04135 [Corynebacterium riegelii]
MSEPKQLTVAEILARAQKENPELGTRRRRRRSLEDGGVSVAELTGSIKKVEAKPAESRHSSVPIDAPAEKPAAPAAPAKPVDSEAPAAAPKVEPKVEKPEVKKVERASEDETAVIKKVSDVPAAPAPKAEAPKTEAPKPAPIVDLDAAPTKVEELEELDEFEDLEGAEDTEEAGVNPITLVLMVFLGVVLGILGFMLFKWLWTSTPTAVAAILGVITVAGSVYAARAIGTGRDWLSVGLAGVAAVVIAFGPALL